MTVVNTPLIRKTVEHITAHPEAHQQDQWWLEEESCGTVGCFAGWAAYFAGYSMTTTPAPRFIGGEPNLDGLSSWTVVTSESGLPLEGTYIADAARELLRVSFEDADELFHEDNSLRDIYRIANRLTDGEIPIPDVLPDGS